MKTKGEEIKITVRLSKEEKQKLLRNAETEGKTLSDYVREQISLATKKEAIANVKYRYCKDYEILANQIHKQAKVIAVNINQATIIAQKNKDNFSEKVAEKLRYILLQEEQNIDEAKENIEKVLEILRKDLGGCE